MLSEVKQENPLREEIAFLGEMLGGTIREIAGEDSLGNALGTAILKTTYGPQIIYFPVPNGSRYLVQVACPQACPC